MSDSETVNEANARRAEEARKLARSKARVELLYQIDRLAERRRDLEAAQQLYDEKHSHVTRLVKDFEELP